MKDSLFVRPATPDDAAAIAEAEARVFAEPYSETAVSGMLTAAYGKCLLLHDGDGNPCGYLLGTCIPPEGELVRIAVLPEKRRFGGARMLMTAFLGTLIQNGCHVCFLDVREHNLAAQALYTSFGFSFCGRRRSYYRAPVEDALEMIWKKEETEQ